MLDPSGHGEAEDQLLEEFAAALFGEVGARAAAVAEQQADQSDDDRIAACWRRIADKVRAISS